MKFKKKKPNPKYTEISIYVIVTVIIIYALAKIADHLGDIVSWIGGGLHTIGVILIPLLLGFVIAYLLFPIVQFFCRHLEKMKFFAEKKRNPRGYAVGLTYLIIVLGIVIFLSVIISVLTREVSVISTEDISLFVTGIVQSLQSVYKDLQNLLDNLNISSDQVQTVVDTVTEWLGGFFSNLGNSLVSSLSNVTGILTNFVFAIILSIYFLLDTENLMEYWDRVLKAVTPKRGYQLVHTALDDADFVFSGYVRGQLIDAIFMAIMISVALSVLNVKFAVPIGILAGIGNLIPYVGPVIAYGLTAIVCVINADWQKLIVAIIVLFIIQTVDGNVINPKLLSSNTNVHPMLVIVALLFGSAIGGILGMLLAVPVAALLKIWFDRFIKKLVEKKAEAERTAPNEAIPGVVPEQIQEKEL